MILSDNEIIFHIQQGNIKIEPFDIMQLGSNSYDLRLSGTLAIYVNDVLDAAKENELEYIKIPKEGFVLMPNQLYLGATIERTESLIHVPCIEGKSSIGRLGIDIHKTAGFGDVGFCGHWTLEIQVATPVRIYAGMPICQIYFQEVRGTVSEPYNEKDSAKYCNQDFLPVGSKMYLNFK